MDECKTQPRRWHLNWSEIRTLEGRGAYLYNPKGEMVAIIFEQDRPEAEGLTAQIMESLNAQLIADHAPAEITVDAEKVWDELWAIYVKLNGPFEDRDDYEDIITVSKPDLIAAIKSAGGGK